MMDAAARDRVDRTCLDKLRAEHPDLLRDALAIIFTEGKDMVSQRLAAERLRARFKGPRIDAAILYELEGTGHIRRSGFAYLLSNRGRVLLGATAKR